MITNIHSHAPKTKSLHRGVKLGGINLERDAQQASSDGQQFLNFWPYSVCSNISMSFPYCGHEAVIQGLVREKNSVFNEDCTGPENKGQKKIDVYVIPGTVELPVMKIAQQVFHFNN